MPIFNNLRKNSYEANAKLSLIVRVCCGLLGPRPSDACAAAFSRRRSESADSRGRSSDFAAVEPLRSNGSSLAALAALAAVCC